MTQWLLEEAVLMRLKVDATNRVREREEEAEVDAEADLLAARHAELMALRAPSGKAD